jgi:hypothetical protein
VTEEHRDEPINLSEVEDGNVKIVVYANVGAAVFEGGS